MPTKKKFRETRTTYHLILIFLLLLAVVLISSKFVFLAPVQGQSLQWKDKKNTTENMFLGKSYFVLLGYQRNFPSSCARYSLSPGIPHPSLGFRYYLSDSWLMGFSGCYQFLVENEYREEIAIVTLAQESMFIYRIDYRLFLICGGKSLYLNPVTKGMLPLQRHPRYSAEIGVAASAGLLIQMKGDYSLELSIQRWRGTKTMKLHATQVQIAFGLKIR